MTNVCLRLLKSIKCSWENKRRCMCNSCWFQWAFTAHHLQVLTVFLYSARWNRWQHLDEDNGIEERAGHVGHQGQLPKEVRGVSLHHNPGTAPTGTVNVDFSALFQDKIEFLEFFSLLHHSPLSYIHFEYLFTEMVPSSLSLTRGRVHKRSLAHKHAHKSISSPPGARCSGRVITILLWNPQMDNIE